MLLEFLIGFTTVFLVLLSLAGMTLLAWWKVKDCRNSYTKLSRRDKK